MRTSLAYLAAYIGAMREKTVIILRMRNPPIRIKKTPAVQHTVHTQWMYVFARSSKHLCDSFPIQNCLAI